MSSTKTIEDLRARLFDAIDAVKAGTMNVEQASTIGNLSQTIINSAKVEIDYIHATDRIEGSRFLAAPEDAEGDGKPINGITGIVRHRLQG